MPAPTIREGRGKGERESTAEVGDGWVVGAGFRYVFGIRGNE